MKLQSKLDFGGITLAAALWLATLLALPQSAAAQTHLFPETNGFSMATWASTWEATPSVSGSSLNLTFQNNPAAGPAVWLNASNTNWTGAEGFVVDLSNPSPGSVGLIFQVFDAAGDSGPNLWVEGSLYPGESAIWSAELNSNSSTYGMEVAPPLVIGPGVISLWGAWFGGTFGLSHVNHVKITMSSYTGTNSPMITIRSMRAATPASEAALYTGLMDQFGQYAQGSWINKVATTADLAARLAAENADLAAHPVSTNWDTYGGWATGPSLTPPAGGFFSTTQYNGKWWLITPSGHLFWFVGLQDIGPSYFAIGLAGNMSWPSSRRAAPIPGATITPPT